jgi:signal transduction histidine kinase
LRNLIDNALTHCPVDTMVTVQVLSSGPEGVRLEVIDTGPRLSDSDLTLLRGRLDPAGGVRTGTRGLGLHIVAEIALALRATVTLERGANGQGLVWSVSLPGVAG